MTFSGQPTTLSYTSYSVTQWGVGMPSRGGGRGCVGRVRTSYGEQLIAVRRVGIQSHTHA